MNFITLCKATLIITICTVGTFYQGTRFDWLGIVKSLDYECRNYVDGWFVDQDPKNHEHVCESFSWTYSFELSCAGVGRTADASEYGKNRH